MPIHAPERQSLLPVIAMLLQFEPQEVAAAIKAVGSPVWEPALPKEIDFAAQLAKSSHGSSQITSSGESDVMA